MLTIGNLPRDTELLHDNENKTLGPLGQHSQLCVLYILLLTDKRAKHMKAALLKRGSSLDHNKWMQSLAVSHKCVNQANLQGDHLHKSFMRA